MVVDIITGFLTWLSQTVNGLIDSFGLAGLFAAAVLANATIFLGLPFEAILVAFALASQQPHFLIALVAGAGAAIGELTGYAIGRAGAEIKHGINLKNNQLFFKLKEQIDLHGPVAVFFLLLLPIPFDLVGLAAGVARMNPVKFIVATFAGKTARYFIILTAAVAGIAFLLSFFGVNP